MTNDDVSLLLGLLGGTSVLASWIGRRTGDALRDVGLMLGAGACLLALAGGLSMA
jgi:hypothetical protein